MSPKEKTRKLKPGEKPSDQPAQQDHWWKVMCLTGVDYFSTLGYQPGIAFLAAGILSPISTLVLVVVTIFCALPVYYVVARHSPNGEGSLAMLEKLLSGWLSKIVILLLLGFAATDFIITITLSAADAAAHIVQNPLFVRSFHTNEPILITLILIFSLAAIFYRGFNEAIGLCFVIVTCYLILNAILVLNCFGVLSSNWQTVTNWQSNLFSQFSSVPAIFLAAALVFPKLALGLSGFETGVAVMPLVKGAVTDTEENKDGRILHTRFLLATAALIMSVFLMGSSVVSTLLIAHESFAPGGPANGRALAYLAHKYMGESFGTAYDISTILILWFAGASAIAGLLGLVPKYLPRFGMAPAWTTAVRPLVIFFTAVGFAVTILFRADVDAQAGAYATGVLVLMTSAAVVSTIKVWKEFPMLRGWFCIITLIFIYTTGANITERPDGLRIATFFILCILFSSALSRALRSTELRIERVEFDETAKRFIEQACKQNLGQVRLLAHRIGRNNYKEKEENARRVHSIQLREGDFIFVEVEPTEVSNFGEALLEVSGIELDGYKIMRCKCPAVPNGIAAILLNIRRQTEKNPHVYLGWTEGDPIANVFKYIFFGEGETAMLTREILRCTEAKESKRPFVHLG